MNSLTKIIAAAAFPAVLSLSTAVAVQAADAMTMQPLHALSFNGEVPRGSERVRTAQNYSDASRVR